MHDGGVAVEADEGHGEYGGDGRADDQADPQQALAVVDKVVGLRVVDVEVALYERRRSHLQLDLHMLFFFLINVTFYAVVKFFYKLL